ncbi:MAG: hypothetical protein GY931_16110 [Maribacter sp.]|nr:hypothetical protein [Maribacter sp.]
MGLDPTINFTEENLNFDKEILKAELKEILKAEDQIISLIVKAEGLYNLEKEYTQTQVDKYSILEDKQHSSQLAPLKNFISEVFIGHKVSWNGQSIDDGYTVLIESITYKHDFLEESQPISGIEGMVTTKIKNDKELEDKIFEYKINFSIYKEGADPKYFMIDPKLCGNT